MAWSGKVVRFSTEGTLILRSAEAPPIGRFVCDLKGRDIGKIVRVTGPVSSPYVIVRPKGGLPEGANRMLGRELFLSRAPTYDDRRQRKGGNDRGRKTDRRSVGQYPPRDNEPPRRRVHRSVDRGDRG